MRKKDIMELAMMTAAMSSTPSLYGGFQRSQSKPIVTKCSQCPEFGRKCPIRNGELKPCSKYR